MTLTSQVESSSSSLPLSWQPLENLVSEPLCVFFLIGPSCRHIKKGTDQTLLKKLSGNSNLTSCQDCNNEENKENISSSAQEQDSGKSQETPVVWMCLKCGHRVSLYVQLIL